MGVGSADVEEETTEVDAGKAAGAVEPEEEEDDVVVVEDVDDVDEDVEVS